MIVVLLHYVVPLDRVDAHLPAHVEWLQAGVEAGMLLLAGRQVPRTGGCLLARGSRAEVEAWAATDPFAIHGLADYSFHEIAPSVVAPGWEALAA